MRTKCSGHDWSCECPWCYVMLPGISAHRISSPPSAILAEYDVVCVNSVRKVDAPLEAYSLQCYAMICCDDMVWAFSIDSEYDATLLQWSRCSEAALCVLCAVCWAELSVAHPYVHPWYVHFDREYRERAVACGHLCSFSADRRGDIIGCSLRIWQDFFPAARQDFWVGFLYPPVDVMPDWTLL